MTFSVDNEDRVSLVDSLVYLKKKRFVTSLLYYVSLPNKYAAFGCICIDSIIY